MFTCGVQETKKSDSSDGRTERACQQVELRTIVRYRLGAPVVFSWRGQGPVRLQGEGITRDISARGAFILTPTSPPAEVMVMMEIFLPPLRDAGQSVRLVTEGRVIRIEHPAAETAQDGFAVVSEGFDIPELAGEN
jgi:hypothetical protein